MVAALCLFNPEKVFIEFLLRRKCNPVDPLKHLILLVASPVRPGNAHQLDELDLAG